MDRTAIAKRAAVISAGAAGLVVAGPPAALVAAGIAWGVTDTEYYETWASSVTAVKDKLFNRTTD